MEPGAASQADRKRKTLLARFKVPILACILGSLAAAGFVADVRSNLKSAARIRPVRETPAGEVDVAGIAEAVDNTELAALAAAVEAKDRPGFARAYDDTITACYACHKAIGKPYLRPRRPVSPEVQAINLDPAARWPQ